MRLVWGETTEQRVMPHHPTSQILAYTQLVARQREGIPIWVLIAAPAGYGKSFFATTCLRHERLHKRKWRVAAPSGVAAVNIGGCTLHSLLQMNAQCVTRLDDESVDAAALTEVEGIIIDECTMVDI